MHNETAKGDNPVFTSFVGASAAPSQTPAVKPQITPSPCSETLCFFDLSATPATVPSLMKHHEQDDACQQDEKRDKKVAVGDDGLCGTDETHSISFSMVHVSGYARA
jgi:hypothetical protein